MSIHKTPTSASPGKMAAALMQDPRKTGVLGVLALTLLIMCGRLMIGQSRPATASASMLQPTAPPPRIVMPAPPTAAGGASALLRVWLSTPIPAPARNDFLLKSEYHPAGVAKTLAVPRPDALWQGVEKFLSLQADQKEKRIASIAALKTEAAALRPTSTVMGASPRAMVNGAMVRVGDTIGPFQVLKIEPRGIVVESDGVRLAIPMN